ncbi:sulfite exporter TauE/SafE family protein [Dermatobacter hominis]|uniref:sulfite exporter TauE/SafE family protein n=1 Tax=Dermatobacter hominis TaxID=2884263 RepID=UPI001D11050A|nr:sulfite exporter TauE/SafE family protein [Dermatobacter hominis]UDY34589.1 sulfite exporter TauE/SafE family protein [Dermatobacter hominis]
MDWSDVATVAVTVLVGVGAGMLSALLGVGGAVITTPAVRVLGATPLQAVGSTVPAILPGAIAGTLRYAREGLVDWSAALGLGIAGAVFAIVGALTSDQVDGGVLMVLTAALMLWSGFSVVRGGRRAAAGPGDEGTAAVDLVAPEEEDEGLIGEAFEGTEASETETAFAVSRPEGPIGTSGRDGAGGTAPTRHPLPMLAVLGAASGFVAGLLGVGGGIVMVPVLTGPLRVPMKSAVASSLVAVAIFSVPALVTHAVLGHIDWTYALPLMVGVVPGARIGAHLTIGSSERTVRLLFGALIVVLAVVYGGSELAAL